MRLVKATGVALTMVAAACGEPAAPPAARPPPSVEVLTVAPGEVRQTGEYLGSLLSRQNVTVVPQVAGFVRRVHVRPGERVAAGQTLVEVDARQETAAVDSARAQVASAKAALELAKQTRARSEALFQEGIASAQERDAARAQADAAQAALEAAEAAVAQREVQLQFFAVRAPFAGVVGEVTARVGAFVSATTPLTTLAQSRVLEVSAFVPAERARQIQPGTAVEILDESGQVRVQTEVFFVAPEADARTQLVEVKAVFENDVGLRPSELVRLRIIYAVQQKLQVPVLAVVRQSGQAFVFGVKEVDGKSVVSRRPITLGTLGETTYVVDSGLSEGDVIAVSSIQALRDEMVIVPKAEQLKAADAQPESPRPN